MSNALLLALLFGIPAAFCFLRAYRIQARSAVDGIVTKSGDYAAMRLWIIAGTGFLAFGIVAVSSAVNPGIMQMFFGKR